MKKSGTFWVYALIFFGEVVRFCVADYQSDVKTMVVCGFAGMLWFRLAEREASK